jgi:hypothetical protein
MGVSDLSPERLAAWVEASCRRQGVPARVTDAGVVRAVVALLGGIADGKGAPAHLCASTSPAV